MCDSHQKELDSMDVSFANHFKEILDMIYNRIKLKENMIR